MMNKIIKRTILLSYGEDNEFIYEHIRRFFADGSWDERKNQTRKPDPIPFFF